MSGDGTLDAPGYGGDTPIGELVPRTPQESARKIRKVLANERFMRLKVFADDPAKRRSKVAEIDDALHELENLERMANRGER